MSISSGYTKHVWQDGEDGGTPITARKLNEVEAGIDGNQSAVEQARASADNATAVAHDAAEDAAEAKADAAAAVATATEAATTATAARDYADATDARLTALVEDAVDRADLAEELAGSANYEASCAADDVATATADAAEAKANAAAALTAATQAAEDAAEAVSTARGALPYQHLTLSNASVSRAQTVPGKLVHDATTSSQKIMTPAASNTTVTVPDGVYAITFHVAANASIGFLGGSTIPANGFMAIKNPAETKTVAMQRPHELSYSWTMGVPCVKLGPAVGLEQIKFMYVGGQALTGINFDIHIVRLA